VRDTGDKINGGAVSDAKSPEKDAMLHEVSKPGSDSWTSPARSAYDFRKDVQLPLWAAGTA
jgi:hypothetical protein